MSLTGKCLMFNYWRYNRAKCTSTWRLVSWLSREIKRARGDNFVSRTIADWRGERMWRITKRLKAQLELGRAWTEAKKSSNVRASCVPPLRQPNTYTTRSHALLHIQCVLSNFQLVRIRRDIVKDTGWVVRNELEETAGATRVRPSDLGSLHTP